MRFRIPRSIRAAHRELALQAARESIVLLKNRNDTLPLKPSIRKIAVVGPTADLLESIEGNYNGTAPDPVSPLDGLRKQFGSENIIYAPGSILADGTPAPDSFGVSAHGRFAQDRRIERRILRQSAICGRAEAGARGREDQLRLESRGAGGGFFCEDIRRAMDGRTGAAAGRRLCAERARTAGDSCRRLPAGCVSAPPQSGTQLDRVRLYVDDKLVMDSHSNPANARLSFADTQPHSIRVEYVHLPNDRFVDLEWDPPANSLLGQAIDAAKNSDATVAFVGLSPNLEGEEMNVHVDGFDGGDRTSIELPAAQEHLLEALGATGKPLIVVLTSRQRTGGAVGQGACGCAARGVVSRRRGRRRDCGDACGKEQSRGTVAGYLLSLDRRSACVYRLLDEEQNLSLFQRRCSVSVRVRLELFAVQLSSAPHCSCDCDPRRRSGHGDGRGAQRKPARRRRSGGALRCAAANRACRRTWSWKDSGGSICARARCARVQFTLTPRELSEVDEKGNRAVVPGDYAIYVAGGQPDTGTPATKSTHFTERWRCRGELAPRDERGPGAQDHGARLRICAATKSCTNIRLVGAATVFASCWPAA